MLHLSTPLSHQHALGTLPQMTKLTSIGKEFRGPLKVLVPVSGHREYAELLEKILGRLFHELVRGPRHSVALDAGRLYVLVQQDHGHRGDAHVKLRRLGRGIGVDALPAAAVVSVLLAARGRGGGGAIGDGALGAETAGRQAAVHARVLARYRVVHRRDAGHAHRQEFLLVVRVVERGRRPALGVAQILPRGHLNLAEINWRVVCCICETRNFGKRCDVELLVIERYW